MLLSIIIPQYKETDEIVKPLLDSIALQRGIDFNEIEVIIVNDGTDIKLCDCLCDRPYDITYAFPKHLGVSGARQYGLDIAKGDYVMYCDADDVFCNNLGLWYALVKMRRERGDYDYCTSTFYEEVKPVNSDDLMYIMRGDVLQGSVDGIFIHGKIYRRQFLLDNNIKWKSQLTFNEDSYYNALCLKLSKKTVICDFPFYCWCWRNDSTVRQQDGYGLYSLPQLTDGIDLLTQEFIIRNFVKDACEGVCSHIYDMYYTMYDERWQDKKYDEYKVVEQKRIREFKNKWQFLYDNVDDKQKEELKEKSKNKVLKGLKVDTEPYETWIGG